MKFGIPKSTERKFTRLLLRALPIIPGPELYDIFVDLKEGKKSIDQKIDKAYTSLKETSKLIDELENDLIDRTDKVKQLREKYEEYSKLAEIEEDKIQPLLKQLDLAVGKGRIQERIASFLINLFAGLLIFILGLWLSPKIQNLFASNKQVANEIHQANNNQNSQIAIPNDIILTKRFLVVDGSLEPNLNYCTGEVKQYEIMDELACSFLIGKTEYNLRSKFLYDTLGQVSSYWTYKSEGPLVYKSLDLSNDKKFAISIGADLSPVLLGQSIAFGIDTLKIEKINKELKLLFMESKKTDERTIYEYK